ncbi:DUF624 domain-containing protein [Sporosarcina sp. ANT_H38]|uniref:YesL family protein n=1 Tax=Sporosarcina sp. ANT_H38 TaxID=2597358 RepID=UPI0011F13CCE|nr:DUF624 domain-containing protein [Sporosarcina sp. ANT_H38]KAA0965561.1 DUF624 domain-containing protein [Sporosarcina sp. ANT_H38]
MKIGEYQLDSKGSMGMIYNVSEWVIRYLIVNLLWFIFNIPIVFLLINLLMVKNTNEIIAICIIIFAIMPFLFFPATTGMFAVIRRWFMNERDIPIIRSFWKYYKENYVRSMTGGLIIGGMWLIFAVDYYYFTVRVSESFKYLFIFLFIFLLAFTLHFISTTVHFESKLFKSLKNSILITIGSPILSLGLGIITGLIVYVSFNYLTFIIPLFMGSLLALVSFSIFYKVYLRIESV